MRKIAYVLLLLLFIPSFAHASVGVAYFYSDNCIMCEEIQPFIEEMENSTNITLQKYKVTLSPFSPTQNDSLLKNMSYTYDSVRDVPMLYIANRWFYFGMGDDVEKKEEEIRAFIKKLQPYNIPPPIQNGVPVYPKPVSIIIFYNSSRAESISELESALEKNITFVRVDKINVAEKENRSIFARFGNETPLAVLGNSSFPLASYNISFIVQEAKKYEDIGLDFPEGYEEKSICIVLFYRSTCPTCMRIKAKLEALAALYPLEIKEYDTVDKKNQELLLEYGSAFNLTRYYNTNIFIGKRYFHSETEFDELEREIKRHLGSGLECPMTQEVKEENLLSGILLVVIIGGLLDGINPCAFATLIFFIAYLERARREAMLPIGLSFAAGVYVAYLLILMGLLEFLNVVRHLVSFYLYMVIGVSAMVLGLFSIGDFFSVRKGGKAVLQLPMFLKKRRGRIIKRISEDRKITALIIIAISSGFLIAALEFACTGQVALPVVTVIESSSPLRFVAFAYLLLYDFMFILPLLIILLLFHKGKSSAALGKEHMKKYAYTKLATGIFLMVLAFFMLNHVFGWIAI